MEGETNTRISSEIKPSFRCGNGIQETRSGKGTEAAIGVVMQAGIGGMRDTGTLIEIDTRTVV